VSDDGLRAAWRAELDDLAARGLARAVQPLDPRARATDFTTNDYLGLSQHADVLEAIAKATREHGAGARASRLLGGGSPFDVQAEQALADWLGAEAALLFPTGFQANLGLATTIAGHGDVLLSDAAMHASMIDACRLSRAQVRVFAHNDLEHLESLLALSRGARRRFVLTEGVFSMDGDRAPIAALDALCARCDAWLVVDEAHSLGVVGPEGAGVVVDELDPVGSRVVARVVTGGKALGSAGGFVVGSRELRERLVHGARSFVFTTGTTPGVAGGLAAAIPLARAADSERLRIRELGATLAQRLDLPEPPSAIVPFVVGANEPAMALAESLRDGGLEVRAVRPPTVPEGTARLRLVLHAYNDSPSVERLCDALEPARGTSAPRSAARMDITARTVAAQPLVVAGTDTEIGKTVVSALLARAFAARGPVRYWKPVQTGDDSDTRTVRALAAGCDVEFGTPAYEFPLPASPHEAAADAGACIDYEVLLERFGAERADADPRQLLVELAGGLLVPYDDTHTQLDALARLRPRLVLAARSGLGTLNHTLLSLEALRARGLEPEALFLVGDPHPSNRATLSAMGRIERVFEVPRFTPLDAAALDGWIEEHAHRLP